MKKINRIALALYIGAAVHLASNHGVMAQPPNLPQAKASAIAVGDDPRCAVAGDFNGDGRMDIATANQGDKNVSILLAQPAGGYVKAPNSPIKVGASPRALAVGDFNRDKEPDLAVCNSGDNSVTILLGAGEGQFFVAPGSPLKIGSRPMSVVVSDFDADGKADLAVVNNTSESIAILRGDGTGSFTEAPQSPYTVGKAPFFVGVSDMNLDGEADLVVANSGSNNISVLMGKGGGHFDKKRDFAVGTSPRSLAITDVNNDNKADIVVANSSSNNISLLLGNGDGDFNPKIDLPVAPNPRSVVAGDFDNNGNADLAVASFAANQVQVFFGEGKGAFSTMPGGVIPVGSEPIFLVAADVNANLKTDLIVVNADSNDVSVLTSNGNRTFKY